jgi:two-component system cell cycle sensor histidine kinase/response regulator CckA
MLVLVVDDEPVVLRMATTALAMGGYRAIIAENGVAGLECYLKAPDKISLVLADVIMPMMTGIEMADKVVNLQPAAKILLMSGYSDDVIDVQARQRFPFIRKPFLPADLIRKIETLLGNSAAASAIDS